MHQFSFAEKRSSFGRRPATIVFVMIPGPSPCRACDVPLTFWKQWKAPIEIMDRSVARTVLWSCIRPFQLLVLEPMCLYVPNLHTRMPLSAPF